MPRSNILHFHGHQRSRCAGTHDRCYEGRCHQCELYTCKRCGASEGEMPTDCPGYILTYETREAIMQGEADFRWREGWVVLNARGLVTPTPVR